MLGLKLIHVSKSGMRMVRDYESKTISHFLKQSMLPTLIYWICQNFDLVNGTEKYFIVYKLKSEIVLLYRQDKLYSESWRNQPVISISNYRSCPEWHFGWKPWHNVSILLQISPIMVMKLDVIDRYLCWIGTENMVWYIERTCNMACIRTCNTK